MFPARRTISAMPRYTRLASPLALFALAFSVAVGTVQAQPSVPATFYGTVVVDGEPVPDGTEVRAFIGGHDCTQDGSTYRRTAVIDGVSQYSIEVVHQSQREGCGVEGAEVQFMIGDHPAHQVASWRPGPQQLNLHAGTGEPAKLPTPAPDPTPGSAEAAATATAQAIYTPITGETPPIDEDIDLDELPGFTQRVDPQSPGERDALAQETGDDDSNNNDGIALWLIGVIIALIVVGIVIGWVVAGRRHLS